MCTMCGIFIYLFVRKLFKRLVPINLINKEQTTRKKPRQNSVHPSILHVVDWLCHSHHLMSPPYETQYVCCTFCRFVCHVRYNVSSETVIKETKHIQTKHRKIVRMSELGHLCRERNTHHIYRTNDCAIRHTTRITTQNIAATSAALCMWKMAVVQTCCCWLGPDWIQSDWIFVHTFPKWDVFIDARTNMRLGCDNHVIWRHYLKNMTSSPFASY